MELDTGFRPSEHGFAFPNAWPDSVLGLFRSRGRCGGMVFASLDAFVSGVTLPQAARSASIPSSGSGLARWIRRRQVESVTTSAAVNTARFVRFTYLPTSHPLGVEQATVRSLLPLFDLLRSGRPAPLGMVSALGLPYIARNHQVLAYAADFGEKRVTVRVYDPNHPSRDDVTLEVAFASPSPVVERIGRQERIWRGFFLEDYSPRALVMSTQP